MHGARACWWHSVTGPGGCAVEEEVWITHRTRTSAVRVPYHEVCGPWSCGRG